MSSSSSEDSDLCLRYDAEKIRAHWDKRPAEVAARTAEILATFVPYLAKLVLWEYLVRGKIREHEGLQRKYAVRLRQILTDLGPCFIKLGQALSIRPDLLPSACLFELQKLCDAVPSFPTEQALEVMREELQKEPKDVFQGLDEGTEPIAAASLGQVYKLK